MRFRSVFCLVFLCIPLSTPAMAEQKRPCPPDQHWVSAHPRRAYTKTDGTFVSAAHVNSSCHPNPVSYAKWKDRFLNSKPGHWPRISEKQKRWSENEKERVLEALADLPEALLLDSIKGIYRFEKSQDNAMNPASGESGALGVYDAAFAKDTNLARVLAHELAHELFRQFSTTDRRRYALENGWQLITNETTGQKHAAPFRFDYVEEDSTTSVTEDFSNNIEYFLFNPQKILKIAPSTHKWIQSKFGDRFKLGKGVKK